MISYESHEHKLAGEIADTLGDKESLALFLTFTRRYNEQFLRSILAKVMAIHPDKIRKSRGALFTYLVNQHGAQNHSRS